jgi:hypothetical protein
MQQCTRNSSYKTSQGFSYKASKEDKLPLNQQLFASVQREMKVSHLSRLQIFINLFPNYFLSISTLSILDTETI